MATLVPAPDGTGYVNGEKVGSVPEWNVALALDRLGWDFTAQQSYFGGRTVAGGMVLDFIVYTLPLYTPVFVQGEYWHLRARQRDVDALQIANLRRYFSNQLREPVILVEPDLLTFQDAYYTCLEQFGKAS